MKMRKILSFVLVLSLVLGSFSMAFAATPSTGLSDIAGVANEDAIKVNADLGIITGFPDGTFLPEKSVTRAEFAAMITRALAVPESALAGYTSTTFKDTAGYGWAVPYLAFAQSKGIMIGDGQGNAMPGRTINVNEAMTMVLRAIGYVNHSAELVGTWPSNYVTVAQNVGLYDDVAATLTVDRANAAQIIYNALTVQKVSVNADGETKYLTLSGTTEAAVLLNTGLNCTYAEELVLYDNSALINVAPYVGAWANVYKNSDKEVVAISPISEFVTGEFDGNGTFTIDKVDYTVKQAGTTTLAGAFVNAKLMSTTSTIADAATSGGSVTLSVEKSGKNN
jgi:S-layer homology domain.